MYNLYFENTIGQLRLIWDDIKEDDILSKINWFCDEKNFKIHYVRRWINKDGDIQFDVGSHTEFFIAKEIK